MPVLSTSALLVHGVYALPKPNSDGTMTETPDPSDISIPSSVDPDAPPNSDGEILAIHPSGNLEVTWTVEINYREKAKFATVDAIAESRSEALGIGRWAAEELREEVAPGDEMEPSLSITNVSAELIRK